MGDTAIMPKDVTATMKYVVRGEKATFHAGDREKSYWPGEDHEVVFHDMRPIADRLSFDRNGFLLLDEPTDVGDFTDQDQLARYCSATEALVQRLTGSLKTISFGPIIRTSEQGAHGHKQPAFGAHVDYGDRTTRDFTYDHLPKDEADRLLSGRFMLINVWRPIVPVESTPFALCDASTVRREDLFTSEVVGGLGDYKRRSLWGWNLAFSPDHKWYWVPRMRPDEVLVFKLFDSDPDAVQFTAHSAFQDPTAAPGANPRQSIELRTISYLG